MGLTILLQVIYIHLGGKRPQKHGFYLKMIFFLIERGVAESLFYSRRGNNTGETSFMR